MQKSGATYGSLNKAKRSSIINVVSDWWLGVVSLTNQICHILGSLKSKSFRKSDKCHPTSKNNACHAKAITSS